MQESAFTKSKSSNNRERFLMLGIEALQNNFLRLRHPYKLSFSVTYRCQSRCKTCNIWRMKPQNELSLDEIRMFAEKNTHFKWVSITGGEPFLRSDIAEIVGIFMKNWSSLYLVTIPTNSLTSKNVIVDKVKRMLDMRVPKLSITLSLDGYRELHDQIRGVNGAFDKVIALAKEFKELQKTYKNLFFVFGYTISKYNIGMLERTYECLRDAMPEVTRNDIHINVAQNSDIYYNNSSLDIKADRGAIANELREFINKRKPTYDAISIIEDIFLKNLVKYVETGRTPMRSRSLDASLFMDSYGTVFPSIMWDARIGSIREAGYSLEPIWKSSAADRARKKIREGLEPSAWTACEAYQAIVANAPCFASLLFPAGIAKETNKAEL